MSLAKLRSANGFTLVEVMVAVVIVGILATVAIPSFIRYQRRMKTTEAFDELELMYKGAATYYSTAYLTSNGKIAGCQFPRSHGLTPAESCCNPGVDANGDTRCDANQDPWNQDTWSALSFEMRDEHYFRYGFESNGEALKDAKATLYAHADLDCDGVQSTFQRVIFGDPKATKVECASVGSAEYYIMDETE